jgi:hypothetical protein
MKIILILVTLILISCKNTSYEKFKQSQNAARVYDNRQEIFLSNIPVVKYTSAEGQRLFKNADHLESFFPLSQFYSPQRTTSTCGPASMRIVLSSLYYKMKKPFLFDQDGSFDEKANGRNAFMFRMTERNSFNYMDKPASGYEVYANVSREKISNYAGMGGEHVARILRSHAGIDAKYIVGLSGNKSMTESQMRDFVEKNRDCTENCKPKYNYDISKKVDSLRSEIKLATQSDNRFIIAYFAHSKTLPGAHSGHFSPIAAYNAKEDMVLIMDVADYLGSWYWIKTEDLYKTTMSEVSGGDRGYIVAWLK